MPKLQKKKEKNSLVVALADHLKIEACAKYNISYERVFIEKDEESRKILQITGTEEGRDKYGDDIWIKILLIQMRIYHERGIKRFLVTDVRFLNEVEVFKGLGAKIIRINAPKRNYDKLYKEAKGDKKRMDELMKHKSETDLDNYKGFDLVIDNDYENEDEISSIIDNFIS